jgi:hypothetical protein
VLGVYFITFAALTWGNNVVRGTKDYDAQHAVQMMPIHVNVPPMT